jgi:hypothetical protein
MKWPAFKKKKKVDVCLGKPKISMLNKTQNKGREPAGINSKIWFYFFSLLYEPMVIWDASKNWGEEKENKFKFSFFKSIIGSSGVVGAIRKNSEHSKKYRNQIFKEF